MLLPPHSSTHTHTWTIALSHLCLLFFIARTRLASNHFCLLNTLQSSWDERQCPDCFTYDITRFVVSTAKGREAELFHEINHFFTVKPLIKN